MKISIGIILYKGEKYLESCISSLLFQTYKDFELLLRDQSPNFEAIRFLKKNLPQIVKDPRVKIFQGKNLWHSGGHNALISKMSKNSEAYICASNDMLYNKNFLENLVKDVKKNEEFSVFVPKLLRWDFQSFSQNKNNGETQYIDSCGISGKKNHHFFDRGQGEKDEGQFDSKKEIFGGSGALFLIKKTALEKIYYKDDKNSEKYKNEYFDELLHYKNDIDLAYRLQWAKQRCFFSHSTIAYHDRQVNKKCVKPLWVKESSFFGQLVLIYKNFWGENFPLFVKIQVYMRIILISIFYLFSSPKVLLQYKKFWKNRKTIKKKKESIKRKNTEENIMQFLI